MKTKEEILKWLRQHDWYQSFERNTINYNSKTLNEYLSDIIIKNLQDSVIGNAFYWADTKEGVIYWKEISKEYFKWLKSDNTNKTMKQTIEIEVPEGKKAVWKDGKVVFEDIMPELPKTWKEFCEKYPIKPSEWCITACSDALPTLYVKYNHKRSWTYDANSLPSKEAAEAYLALMQLHQLRDCYRQGWVPDWNNTKQIKYCIENYINIYYNTPYTLYFHFLAFQTEEIAEEFLHNFEDLIRKAGDLIG